MPGYRESPLFLCRWGRGRPHGFVWERDSTWGFQLLSSGRGSPAGAMHELSRQRRRDIFRRDPLVRSVFPEGPACRVHFAMLDYRLLFTGHDKRAPPNHLPERPFPEGPACQVRFLAGTCFSRPLINLRYSICLRRGLKSRSESGAKAPHSMECGDSSPLFREGFGLHHLTVCANLPRPRKRFPGNGH